MTSPIDSKEKSAYAIAAASSSSSSSSAAASASSSTAERALAAIAAIENPSVVAATFAASFSIASYAVEKYGAEKIASNNKRKLQALPEEDPNNHKKIKLTTIVASKLLKTDTPKLNSENLGKANNESFKQLIALIMALKGTPEFNKTGMELLRNAIDEKQTKTVEQLLPELDLSQANDETYNCLLAAAHSLPAIAQLVLMKNPPIHLFGENLSLDLLKYFFELAIHHDDKKFLSFFLTFFTFTIDTSSNSNLFNKVFRPGYDKLIVKCQFSAKSRECLEELLNLNIFGYKKYSNLLFDLFMESHDKNLPTSAAIILKEATQRQIEFGFTPDGTIYTDNSYALLKIFVKAIEEKKESLIKLLVTDETLCQDPTILIAAAKSNNDKLVEILIKEKGANPSKALISLIYLIISGDLDSSWWNSICSRFLPYQDTILKLIQLGADINQHSDANYLSDTGYTTLLWHLISIWMDGEFDWVLKKPNVKDYSTDDVFAMISWFCNQGAYLIEKSNNRLVCSPFFAVVLLDNPILLSKCIPLLKKQKQLTDTDFIEVINFAFSLSLRFCSAETCEILSNTLFINDKDTIDFQSHLSEFLENLNFEWGFNKAGEHIKIATFKQENFNANITFLIKKGVDPLKVGDDEMHPFLKYCLSGHSYALPLLKANKEYLNNIHQANSNTFGIFTHIFMHYIIKQPDDADDEFFHDFYDKICEPIKQITADLRPSVPNIKDLVTARILLFSGSIDYIPRHKSLPISFMSLIPAQTTITFQEVISLRDELYAAFDEFTDCNEIFEDFIISVEDNLFQTLPEHYKKDLVTLGKLTPLEKELYALLTEHRKQAITKWAKIKMSEEIAAIEARSNDSYLTEEQRKFYRENVKIEIAEKAKQSEIQSVEVSEIHYFNAALKHCGKDLEIPHCENIVEMLPMYWNEGLKKDLYEFINKANSPKKLIALIYDAINKHKSIKQRVVSDWMINNIMRDWKKDLYESKKKSITSDIKTKLKSLKGIYEGILKDHSANIPERNKQLEDKVSIPIMNLVVAYHARGWETLFYNCKDSIREVIINGKLYENPVSPLLKIIDNACTKTRQDAFTPDLYEQQDSDDDQALENSILKRTKIREMLIKLNIIKPIEANLGTLFPEIETTREALATSLQPPLQAQGNQNPPTHQMEVPAPLPQPMPAAGPPIYNPYGNGHYDNKDEKG